MRPIDEDDDVYFIDDTDGDTETAGEPCAECGCAVEMHEDGGPCVECASCRKYRRTV